MSDLNNRSMKKWIIIGFWILMIVVSFQARDLLSGGVTSSTTFVDQSTESGKGSTLYKERFNVTSNTVYHIIVIELNSPSENIQSNEWRNFTLFLTLYLNESFYERNYTLIFSEPLLLQIDGAEQKANELVSKDKQVGLINMVALQDDLDDFEKDVVDIRNLLADVDAIYGYAVSQTSQDYVDNYLPSKDKFLTTHLILTGSLANFADIIEVSKKAFESSEVIAVIVVLFILAFVFRSPLGLAIPIVSMIAALFPTYLTTFLMSELGILEINDFLPAIIAMIGIAVAIDYNLFSLVRFKEEFHKRKAIGLTENKWSKDDIRHAELESSAIMNKTAGNAVMYSGITVLIGFVSLLVLQSDFSNGMALAVSMVVIFSIITARTLTPAILGLFGRYIDWPNITTRSNQAIKDQQDKKVIKTIWTKWSNLVMKNAFPFLILGIIIILPVTFLALQTNLGFDTVKNLPRGTESRDGFEVLSEKFDLGSANPYEVIINTKKENGVFNPYVILATNELAKWAFDYSETLNNKNLTFKTISSYSVYTNTTSGELKLYSPSEIDFYLNYAPIGARKSFREFIIDPYVNTQNTTQINNTLLIKLTSNLDQGSNEAWHLVVKIREKAHELFDKLGAEVFVFGFAASFYDTQQSIYGDTPLMLTVAVILIFIALMILFRSILLPAKAIITISGSILFSLGALVYVFQQGNFLWVVNAEQVDGITFFIPVFLFTIVLGLGMDYSIFIISRIREEYIKGADPHDAVGIGLSKTANVVTSAATVMIATFIVFALAPILFLKTMGVAMSVAIFIDATVSRMILLPSAMALAGRWNWYLPKWLKKILPEIKLDH